LAPIRIAPLKEAVLDDIFCICARAQNAISQPEQTGPRLLEKLDVGIIHLRSARHPIASFSCLPQGDRIAIGIEGGHTYAERIRLRFRLEEFDAAFL
jgi:hypothetical protein